MFYIYLRQISSLIKQQKKEGFLTSDDIEKFIKDGNFEKQTEVTKKKPGDGAFKSIVSKFLGNKKNADFKSIALIHAVEVQKGSVSISRVFGL